ncbi:glycyl radical enzyme domain-containing protein [Shigella flexneri]
MGHRISAQLAEFVANTPVDGWQKCAMLHAQSGISSDIGTTPAVRLPYATKPHPITRSARLVARTSRSIIIPASATFRRSTKPSERNRDTDCNSFASVPFKPGTRRFTANVSGNDSVRVTR